MTPVLPACILQTIWEISKSIYIPKTPLRHFTSHILSHVNIAFQEADFEDNLPDEKVHYSQYTNYILRVLRALATGSVSEFESVCFHYIAHNYNDYIQGSEYEIRRLWRTFIRLCSTNKFPPCLQHDKIILFNEILDDSSISGRKRQISFELLLECFKKRKFENPVLNVLSLLNMSITQADLFGWVEVRCTKCKQFKHFTQRWCAIAGAEINLYSFQPTTTTEEVKISLTNMTKLRLACDKKNLQQIICLTIENGLIYQFRFNDSIASWYECIEKLINCFESAKTKQRKEVTRKITQSLDIEKRSMSITTDQSSQNQNYEPKSAIYETNNEKQNRWENFVSFKRVSRSGSAIMTSRTRILADIKPGTYKLSDLMPIRDLPPLKPKHTVIKNILWNQKQDGEVSGKLIFPPSFNEVIATEYATSEFLSYYGCKFADTSIDPVSLTYRHGVQDFNYKNGYLQKYVLQTGAGLEKHDFTHLDCPLEDESGYFILGEIYDESEIHLTAFRIPPRHTLYVPGGCIHSNDYLQGVWRTMLSDETDIDHVLLTKKVTGTNHLVKFHFKFE